MAYLRCYISCSSVMSVLFFNATPHIQIYTLSLHDALPIYPHGDHGPGGILQHAGQEQERRGSGEADRGHQPAALADRKSTRLNSSHTVISYAVFCLKKKRNTRLDC